MVIQSIQTRVTVIFKRLYKHTFELVYLSFQDSQFFLISCPLPHVSRYNSNNLTVLRTHARLRRGLFVLLFRQVNTDAKGNTPSNALQYSTYSSPYTRVFVNIPSSPFYSSSLEKSARITVNTSLLLMELGKIFQPKSTCIRISTNNFVPYRALPVVSLSDDKDFTVTFLY